METGSAVRKCREYRHNEQRFETGPHRRNRQDNCHHYLESTFAAKIHIIKHVESIGLPTLRNLTGGFSDVIFDSLADIAHQKATVVNAVRPCSRLRDLVDRISGTYWLGHWRIQSTTDSC
jgi:hypothetical protein